MRAGECNQRVEVFLVLFDPGKRAPDDQSAHGMPKKANFGNGGVFGELVINLSC